MTNLVRTIKALARTQTDPVEQMLARWNAEKNCRVFPTSIRYSGTNGLAVLTFENGASYRFNPLHIQEFTMETPRPTDEQLGDVMIRAGGESLHCPQLDASIGIDNLLLGRYNTDEWMRQLKAAA